MAAWMGPHWAVISAMAAGEGGGVGGVGLEVAEVGVGGVVNGWAAADEGDAGVLGLDEPVGEGEAEAAAAAGDEPGCVLGDAVCGGGERGFGEGEGEAGGAAPGDRG